MPTVRAILPAFGTGLALALGGHGEKVAFQPEPDSVLRKDFTTESELTLDALSLIVNGQDVGGMIGQVEVSVRQETRISVTDAYKAVAGGRPTELLRTFETLTSQMTMEVSPAPDEVPEFSGKSELEGKTVAFRWDEEEQQYERSFHEQEGDQALLDDLEEDMDLRVFLPHAEVSAGDTWSVELARLEPVAMPGGNLRLLPEDMDFDAQDLEVFEELFEELAGSLGELLEGECKCTYKGTREEGGVQSAEVAIELEIAVTLDLSAFLDKVIRTAIDESGAGEEVSFSIDTADLNLDFEGEGTLLWNLGAGRMQSFQITGDFNAGIDLALSVDVEDGSQEIDASLEFSGSLRQEVETGE
jgi:hypothetical protein